MLNSTANILDFDLEHYIPHPEKEGYLKLERYATFAEVEAAVIALLKSNQVESFGEMTPLYDVFEWVGLEATIRHGRDQDKSIPEWRTVACYATRGTCEGYLLHIDLITKPNRGSNDLRVVPLISGKCWEFSQAQFAADLCSRMLHDCKEPPAQVEATSRYLVKLKLTIGEIEKKSLHLVEANDETAAEKAAIEREAHSDLDWDGEGAYDMDGEMHYRALWVKSVDPVDVATLKRYL